MHTGYPPGASSLPKKLPGAFPGKFPGGWGFPENVWPSREFCPSRSASLAVTGLLGEHVRGFYPHSGRRGLSEISREIPRGISRLLDFPGNSPGTCLRDPIRRAISREVGCGIQVPGVFQGDSRGMHFPGNRPWNSPGNFQVPGKLPGVRDFPENSSGCWLRKPPAREISRDIGRPGLREFPV